MFLYLGMGPVTATLPTAGCNTCHIGMAPSALESLPRLCQHILVQKWEWGAQLIQSKVIWITKFFSARYHLVILRMKNVLPFNLVKVQSALVRSLLFQ